MVTVSIPPSEVRRFQRAVKDAEREIERRMKAIILKYAYRIDGSAKRNLDRAGLPGVDTGAARAATKVEWDEERFVADVLTKVFYAIYIHDGTGVHAAGGDGRKTPWVYFDEVRGKYFVTRGMMPNPYLLDAFNEHINDFIRDLRALLK